MDAYKTIGPQIKSLKTLVYSRDLIQCAGGKAVDIVR